VAFRLWQACLRADWTSVRPRGTDLLIWIRLCSDLASARACDLSRRSLNSTNSTICVPFYSVKQTPRKSTQHALQRPAICRMYSTKDRNLSSGCTLTLVGGRHEEQLSSLIQHAQITWTATAPLVALQAFFWNFHDDCLEHKQHLCHHCRQATK